MRAQIALKVPQVAGGLMVALVGGLIWHGLNFPLPWLVGPLYAVALARIFGLDLTAPPGARQTGQWVIGVGMGLHFTPAVLAEVTSHAVLVSGMAFVSLLTGVAGASALLRLRRVNAPTAYFSSMPGGASEMANLSSRWNASIDLVAAAHATRVMLIVLVVPLALTVNRDQGAFSSSGASLPVAWHCVPLMIAASLGGVVLFKALRLPNAWVLGALAAVAALAISGQPVSALPDWMPAAGQILIGISLGCRFGPEFLRRAPVFLFSTLVISGASLGLVAALAYGLENTTRLAFANLILSFAPGGIAEMSITASHLNLDVPLVVASHVVRTAVVTLMAPMGFELFRKLNRSGL